MSSEMANGKKSFTFEDFGLLQSNELYQYLLRTSVFPREAQILKELRDASTVHKFAHFGTAPDAGQFISLLLKLVNAKKTIELGVFTGYSLLLTALALPKDGKVIGIDVDRKAYEIGLPSIKKSGVEHKIEFVESQALPFLDKLLQDPANHGSFDFAFVDADKANSVNYHERLLKLVKVGGVILYDNTLWGGTVAVSDINDVHPNSRKIYWKHTIELNEVLANDQRIDISQIALGDGMTLCRRV